MFLCYVCDNTEVVAKRYQPFGTKLILTHFCSFYCYSTKTRYDKTLGLMSFLHVCFVCFCFAFKNQMIAYGSVLLEKVSSWLQIWKQLLIRLCHTVDNLFPQLPVAIFFLSSLHSLLLNYNLFSQHIPTLSSAIRFDLIVQKYFQSFLKANQKANVYCHYAVSVNYFPAVFYSWFLPPFGACKVLSGTSHRGRCLHLTYLVFWFSVNFCNSV